VFHPSSGCADVRSAFCHVALRSARVSVAICSCPDFRQVWLGLLVNVAVACGFGGDRLLKWSLRKGGVE
jgi:hypothetical protein